jgi:hypothetical protein
MGRCSADQVDLRPYSPLITKLGPIWRSEGLKVAHRFSLVCAVTVLWSPQDWRSPERSPEPCGATGMPMPCLARRRLVGNGAAFRTAHWLTAGESTLTGW